MLQLANELGLSRDQTELASPRFHRTGEPASNGDPTSACECGMSRPERNVESSNRRRKYKGNASRWRLQRTVRWRSLRDRIFKHLISGPAQHAQSAGCSILQNKSSLR